MGVLVTRVLLLGVKIRAPDFYTVSFGWSNVDLGLLLGRLGEPYLEVQGTCNWVL